MSTWKIESVPPDGRSLIGWPCRLQKPEHGEDKTVVFHLVPVALWNDGPTLYAALMDGRGCMTTTNVANLQFDPKRT